LQGGLKGLKEWNEGYEDLEAIAFSFVVEFKDGRGFWSMYADTEDEKVRTLSVRLNGGLTILQFKILGLFKVAGGL